MDASAVIALGSLALAALTVLVSYLNVRRQADAARELEHVKWLREKQDELYGRLIDVLTLGRGRRDPSLTTRGGPSSRRSCGVHSDMRAMQFSPTHIRWQKTSGRGLLEAASRLIRWLGRGLLRSIRTELVGERG